MNRKTLGALLLTAGVLVFLVALSADSLGLGSNPGLGAKQIALAVFGVAAASAGMVLRRPPS